MGGVNRWGWYFISLIAFLGFELKIIDLIRKLRSIKLVPRSLKNRNNLKYLALSRLDEFKSDLI